ncbi:MAG TPA: F0F1 ATP synthase subunit epsilon [Pyrinomonadaceae bacterium]|jgi:F-type H+-transporting ATPase subunit epsilon|nr:F0F1 ATP synthase subunit epsilon [Pyrinomonadaceae bacterium]
MAIKLDIVTPEKQVMSDTVDIVTVPTLSGEAGILPNHAPLISALKPGVLSYTKSGTVQKLAVSGGFVEVGVNTVSVLVETAETADEINVEQARAEKEEAEKALAAAKDSLEEMQPVVEKLERAQARLQLVSGK